MKTLKNWLTPIKNFTNIEPWDSSAQKFENRLKKIGIKIPIKLYYKYKLPDNMSLNDFYTLTHKYEIFITFYLAYIAQKRKHKIKNFADDLFNFFFKSDVLSLNDLSYYYTCLDLPDSICESAFRKTYKRALKYMRHVAKELLRLNPELQVVKNYQNYDFIMGAVYGFAPDELDFFTTLTKKREKWAKQLGNMEAVFEAEEKGKYKEMAHVNKNAKTIYNLVGFYPGYILAPKTSDIIIKTTRKHKIKQRTTK